MKKTSHSLDEEAAQAIETLSRILDVSRAEVVRRCTVAMKQAHQSDALPEIVEEGYGPDVDRRKSRDTVGFNGSLGRAPSMGNLPDGSGKQDADVGMERPTESSPESDKRGSEDQNGERNSILDKQLF